MGRRSLLVGLIVGVGSLTPMGSTAWANHTGNTFNCDSFSSQAAAQAHYRQHPGDQDRLDADSDGVACETHSYPAGSPRDENALGPAPATTAAPAAPAPLVSNTGSSRTPRVRIDGREYAAQCGPNTITVDGQGTQGGTLTVHHTFTIDCARASQGGFLPRTGQMILQWTGIGLVLVALGWMLWTGDRFIAGRRRALHGRR